MFKIKKLDVCGRPLFANPVTYIDACVLFGLCSVPQLFNILADLLTWIAQRNGATNLIHYLDDFLTMGPPDSPTCQKNLDTFVQLCRDLGVPLAAEKIESPSTSLTFLGIMLEDTRKMEIRLPNEKLQHIKIILQEWFETQKSYKVADSFLGRAPSACHKSHQMRQNLCDKTICHCCKNQGDALLR